MNGEIIGLPSEAWSTKRLLDHGFINLRDSMPHWSKPGAGDARVVEAARVSNAHMPADFLRQMGLDAPEEERTAEQDEKLIHYLMKNHHTSPFEKVRFEFVCKMPIFVARQWVRHRMASINEVSARYSQLPNEFYVPEIDRMQAQSTSNKQASGEVLPQPLAEEMQMRIRGTSQLAYAQYETLLGQGLARELARMVLPTNFYTTWYWTADLKNLLDFCRLRMHPHAQWEIRVYAEAMLEMARRVAPVAVTAWEKKEAHSP